MILGQDRLKLPPRIPSLAGPGVTSPSAEAARTAGEERANRRTITSPSAEAAQSAAKSYGPPPVNPVKAIPAESFGEARALTAHEYKVNAPELQRLRENNPKAADTIMTEVSAAPMTWEAYDALSPDQRAAVDFNTLLVEAREADLAAKEPMTATEWIEYGNDVREMFGQSGGSRTVAPNTVKLLKSINFKAVGQDLDEFLSMERGISAAELADFSFSKDDVAQLSTFDASDYKQTGSAELTSPQSDMEMMQQWVAKREAENAGETIPGSDEEYANVRSDMNLAAIDTSLIQGVLNTYKQRLASGTGAPWSIEANLLGGNVQDLKPADMPLGYVVSDNPMDYRAQLSIAFDDAYNLLRGNPNQQGLDALFADFTDRNWTEEDKAELWAYLDDRTRRELTYMDDQDAKLVRDILGWE